MCAISHLTYKLSRDNLRSSKKQWEAGRKLDRGKPRMVQLTIPNQMKVKIEHGWCARRVIVQVRDALGTCQHIHTYIHRACIDLSNDEPNARCSHTPVLYPPIFSPLLLLHLCRPPQDPRPFPHPPDLLVVSIRAPFSHCLLHKGALPTI